MGKALNQEQRRKQNLANGLTGEGKPRKHKLWNFGSGIKLADRHKYRTRSYYRKNYEQGLTARGTQRKLGRLSFPATGFGAVVKMSEKEAAWRKLRAEMKVHVPEIILPLQRGDE